MIRLLSDVGMGSLTGAVVLGWLPHIWGIPAAIYFSVKIYCEFILPLFKKKL